MSDQDKTYAGPERRKGERRKANDRREMIRFEPDKEPRRKGKDRRKFSVWDDREDARRSKTG